MPISFDMNARVYTLENADKVEGLLFSDASTPSQQSSGSQYPIWTFSSTAGIARLNGVGYNVAEDIDDEMYDWTEVPILEIGQVMVAVFFIFNKYPYTLVCIGAPAAHGLEVPPSDADIRLAIAFYSEDQDHWLPLATNAIYRYGDTDITTVVDSSYRLTRTYVSPWPAQAL
jgi:hypothetical protein